MLPNFRLLFPLGYICLLLTLEACKTEFVAPPPPDAAIVYPLLETTPVTSTGDAADDPAIWVNPHNLAASLVIGTDKEFGIEVYNLQGERIQSIAAGRTNNVDLRMLPGGGRWTAIAAASNRTSNSISLFLIDQSGQLYWLEDSEIATGLNEPYGVCMFMNEMGPQVFVNDTDGSYQQWGLNLVEQGPATSLPRYQARLLREFSVSSQPEGCVADDLYQRLFLGIEAAGVRVLSARHDQQVEMQTLVNIDGTILYADVEGMSLYQDGVEGYLVVSSQGNNSYAVYDRLPPFSYRGSFVVAATIDGQIDGASETDGLAVSQYAFDSRFPSGLLVVQDGYNTVPVAAQNFKYVSWQDVAAALNLP